MRMVNLFLIGFLAGLPLVGGCGDGDTEKPSSLPAETSRASAAPSSTNPTHASRHYLPPQPQAGEFLALVPPKRPPQTMELVSVPVTDVPTLDGHAKESLWQHAPAMTTLDFASQRPITIKSVHTDDQIYFLVTFPDAAPSETHKSWGWDEQESIYKPLNDREDMLVFKWSMVGNNANLAIRDLEPHRADIWFWKAVRTNPVGSADDKWQDLSVEPSAKAQHLTSPIHGSLSFRRLGDAGQSAYEERRLYEYQEPILPKYYPRQPQGSRADVRAKGVWQDGQWTLEFARKLQTGHDDDVAFTPGGVYLFAVSCYEIANDTVNAAWTQPLYRSGDAFDRLLLKIARKDNA